ncbi:MAG: hypothetical protein K9K39_07220 [Desulfohalobiaceae bacterium]|nr:hypothetical protein [Desulfohalobiaceae bacterium]
MPGKPFPRKWLSLPGLSSESRIVLQYALVFFLGLLLLDIVVVGLHYLSSLKEWDSVYDKLSFFVTQLILWELVLVLVVSYVFFQLLRRYKRHKEEAAEFQGLLLQAVSHKMGNFLAAQRVDLELVRDTGSSQALARLESGSSFLERDFRHIIRIIRDYRFEEAEQAPLDFGDIGFDVAEQLRPELEGKLRTRLQSAPVQGCRQEVETVVFLLAENAARYSASRVTLRSGRMSGISYLFIHNDLAGKAAKGTGVGLNIAERLVRRNGIGLRTREREASFAVLLTGAV